MALKIATYNLRAGGRGLEHWRAMTSVLGADILLLQETADPAVLISGLDEYNAHWRPVSTGEKLLPWGSAAIVRGAVRRAFCLDGFEGWVVGVEVEAPSAFAEGKPVRIFSLHAPTRPNTSYAASVNAALDGLRPLGDGAHLIIGGDFNLTISSTLDGDARKITRQEEAIHDRLREEFGLVNCWRAANPAAPLAQTLRWTRDPRIMNHIDGIFAPASWAAALRRCDVVSGDVWDRLSDHNPVIATFEG
ncbi:MAG: endonuclease/exonuclease/phosphatase family protein [Caulobacterales bacterium]